MGRCYEFGVSIREGCDHAMVVPEEAGHCVCVACGSTCPGRFKGCDLVISQPGYVPATAPAWALRPQESEPTTVAYTSTSEAGVLGSDDPYIAPTAPARQTTAGYEALVDLIEDLGKQVAARDAELGALFDRFVDEFTRLRGAVAQHGEVVAGLQLRLVELTGRFDTMLSASLLGPLQRDS